MTRIQKTVFILVAIIALILGLTVNKVFNGSNQADPAALLDAGIVLLPQSRSLPALSLTSLLIGASLSGLAEPGSAQWVAMAAWMATSNICRGISSFIFSVNARPL